MSVFLTGIRRRFFGCLAATVPLVSSYLGGLTPAHAEVRIEGVIEALQIEARDSTVSEILAALGTSYDLKYRDLPKVDRPVTGTFRGSLLQVLSRLLERYDYVVKRSAAGPIEILYVASRLPARQNSAAPTARPFVAAAPSKASVPTSQRVADANNSEAEAAKNSLAEMLNRRCRILPASCR